MNGISTHERETFVCSNLHVSKREPVQIKNLPKIKSRRRYITVTATKLRKEETMSSRAILFSFSLPSPSPSSSPLSRSRNHPNHPPSPFPLQLLSRRRGRGKVWADVKSEKHVPEPSTKYQDLSLHNKVARAGLDGDDDVEEEAIIGSSPWWQVFPKRWVIVILCFSAFLLCNMDRVSLFFNFFYEFISITKEMEI